MDCAIFRRIEAYIRQGEDVFVWSTCTCIPLVFYFMLSKVLFVRWQGNRRTDVQIKNNRQVISPVLCACAHTGGNYLSVVLLAITNRPNPNTSIPTIVLKYGSLYWPEAKCVSVQSFKFMIYVCFFNKHLHCMYMYIHVDVSSWACTSWILQEVKWFTKKFTEVQLPC